MAGNTYFHFKQFSIIQEKSAMKVGIDGVLLGAWVDIENCQRILDIGAGTGLISIMLAQRSQAEIDAVEIDQNAFEEACFNVKNSPWPEKIQVKYCSFQDYVISCTLKYNLIISNPPYFDNSVPAKTESRTQARNSEFLSLKELIFGTKQLLSDDGHLVLIFPFDRKDELICIALEYNLHIHRLMNVRPNPLKKHHRVLISFGQYKKPYQEEELMLRERGESTYSNQYQEIVKDFYLKF